MRSKAPRITHLRRVGITASDPVALADFYERTFGLGIVAHHDGAVYLRGTSDEHHILVIYPHDRASVRLFSLGLTDRPAVDHAAVTLAGRAEMRIVEEPSDIAEPGGGYGLRIADVDGRLIELSTDVAAAGPADYQAVVRPTKISHLVLNSPNIDAYAQFLVEGLGFSVSDEMPHMLFFRCNTDHHSIAVARAPHASLNHIAFEVPAVTDVLKGVDKMAAHGFPPLWGPGRHGPGNNVFGYFVAPNHQVVEYTADVMQIHGDGEHQPRLWQPEDLKVSDPWADPGSLRPTPEAREVMLGEPEPAAVGRT